MLNETVYDIFLIVGNMFSAIIVNGVFVVLIIIMVFLILSVFIGIVYICANIVMYVIDYLKIINKLKKPKGVK